MFDFYSDKPKNLPRLCYRRLLSILESGDQRDPEEALDALTLREYSKDYLKFLWFMPDYLKGAIDQKQSETLSAYLQRNRNKRSDKLKTSVFPHISDEFSLNQDFLESVFNRDALPEFQLHDKVLTIGSCFARNFAIFLHAKGYQIMNIGQMEDLNSPGSNYLLLKYAADIENDEKIDELREFIELIYPAATKTEIDNALNGHLQSLSSIRDGVRSATKIIVTLGNNIDYYHKPNQKYTIFPKFLAMTGGEDIDARKNSFTLLKSRGCKLMLSKFTDVKDHIAGIYQEIRIMNKSCDIIFTVSPVPIDSIFGLEIQKEMAIEVDCISKSTIRAALYEGVFSARSDNDFSLVYYLPSYEIVRWIAPVVGSNVFGAEDAASRHVSNNVLNAVCRFALKAKL